MFGVRVSILGVLAALFAAGCFYPPVTQPPPDEQQEVVIPLPYDLAWDAVNAVITENSFHVQAQDMTNGIIEAVGPRFTLHDADCGKIKSIAGTYTAEPEPNSSSVYNFLVRPRGPEASIVKVRATFNSSVNVPLHQVHRRGLRIAWSPGIGSAPRCTSPGEEDPSPGVRQFTATGSVVSEGAIASAGGGEASTRADVFD